MTLKLKTGFSFRSQQTDDASAIGFGHWYLLVVACQYFALTLTASNNAIFYLSRGITEPWLGYLGLCGAATIICLEFPTGLVADRFGKDLSVGFSMALRGIAALATTVCYGPFMFCVVTIAASVGSTLWSGASEAWFLSRNRSFKKDLTSFFVHMNLAANLSRIAGGALGAMLASIMAGLPFIVCGALLIVLSVIVLSFEKRFSARDIKINPDDKPHSVRHLLKDAKTAVLSIAKDRILMHITVSGVFFIVFCSVPLIYWQPFFRRDFSSIQSLGWIWAGYIFMNACGSLFLKSSLLKTISGITVYRSCIVLCGSCLLASALMQARFILCVAAFFGFQFCLGILGPVRAGLLNAHISDTNRASVLSFIAFAENAGAMAGYGLSGLLCRFLEIKWVFALSTLPLLVSFVVASTAQKQFESRGKNRRTVGMT